MSEEKAGKLFSSITNISDDMIEEAQAAAAARRKPSGWLKWCAAAACICLAVIGTLRLLPDAGIRKEDPAPFAGTETIPAEGLLSTGIIAGAQTMKWAELALPLGEELPLSPVRDSKDAAALPVYQTLCAQSSSDTYRLLLTWVEELSETAKTNLGIKLRCDTEEITDNGKKYDDTAPTYDQSFYYMRVTLYYRDAVATLSAMSEGGATSYNLNDVENLYAAWAKEPLTVAEAGDGEILEAVSPVISFVSDLVGEEYTLDTASVMRSTSPKMGDVIHIRLQSSRVSENELKRLTGQFLVPYLSIRLEDGDGDGVYELAGVSVFGGRYEYIGDYPLISLPRAEEALYNGYAFGYGYCPACLRNDPAVDFSTYDHVQVEYYNRYTEYAVPYYVFYKYLGPAEYRDGSGTYESYAVGYVPAVEVDGLNEFFEEWEARHVTDGHTGG